MNPNIASELFTRMKLAIDFKTSINYLDAGTADERVTTVVYTAVSFGTFTVTDTYSWAGASGVYRPTQMLRSFVP
jgi:hypothetical protein